nr:response regulator [Calothrix sp. MO_167.B42]
TQSLLPYIRPGIIELIAVGDLPLKVTESNNNNTPTQSQPKQAKKPVVACVDDSPQVCQILEQVLTPQGLDVITIQDTTNALTTLLQNKPDLIFLDLIMPVVSGYELCAQLRKISLFSNVPIIILTGSDRVFDRVRAKSVGCNDFISKPIVADKVIDVVKKHIRHQSLAHN